jgi:hypothetical protein
VLHTPVYTSISHPILYVAILTASAKSFAPDRYPALRKLANAMLGTAFADGTADIGLCQALSILSTWKEARDATNYRRVGYAIRLVLVILPETGA